MKFERSGGILLHPTSLPGADGIGDFGPQAYKWVDFLKNNRLSLWQILPLGPTGYGDSPYQCFSAFAGNINLISPEMLARDNLLSKADFSDRPEFPEEKVAYQQVIQWKETITNRAAVNFDQNASGELKAGFEEFCLTEKQWLDDYTLFMTIKGLNDQNSWADWPEPLRRREPAALAEIEKKFAFRIHEQKLKQFFFSKQWDELKRYANHNNIKIIGDAPIFVAYDSADVWVHPDLFYLDENLMPTVVAGVPPDYFSKTGQLWGNPLYRWDKHKESRYTWWSERLKTNFNLFDIIRLDHFRGFDGYWEVPAGMPTAEIGRWINGPGSDFFDVLLSKFGDLPIIAEDLGVITDDVIKLRSDYKLPGMKVLQFAFDAGPDNEFLPHHYLTDFVAYTGTHDNDTTRGWFDSSSEDVQQFCVDYLNIQNTDNVVWEMIRAIWASVAGFALAPMQDFLNLRTEARMNYPGSTGGNWEWRMKPGAWEDQDLENFLRDLNHLYSREAPEA